MNFLAVVGFWFSAAELMEFIEFKFVIRVVVVVLLLEAVIIVLFAFYYLFAHSTINYMKYIMNKE